MPEKQHRSLLCEQRAVGASYCQNQKELYCQVYCTQTRNLQLYNQTVKDEHRTHIFKIEQTENCLH